MIESVVLFSGISALMAAFQVLQRERDYRLAKQTFDRKFKDTLGSSESKKGAAALESIAPPEVIKKLHDNAKRCWEHWLESENEPQMPGQEREADAAVKACVCRQLRRMIDLNGSLPPEWDKFWSQFGCEKRGAST